METIKKMIATVLCLGLLSQGLNTVFGQTPNENNKATIKIALILDTSNSMDGLIDQAKSQLWSIVNELAKAKCDEKEPNLEIALYEYGNDNLSMREGYIRLVTELTNDLDQISDDLFKLTTHGGSEYCGKVIQTSINQLDWSREVKDLQLIFIAGNEPFTQGNVNYNDACISAKNKSVIVNTIYCGNFEEGINSSWKAGADLTGGKYFSIEQNRKTVFIPSPYDDKIAKLNSSLNSTYIAFGKYGQEKLMNQRVQDNNSMSYGKANMVKRTVSKSSHIYKNTTWDLVDASKEIDFEISKIEEDDLPEEMQNMEDEKKIEYIDEKSKQRNIIQSDIKELNKKREAWLADNSPKDENNDMFDKAIVSAIKQLAKEKNYVID